LPPGTYGHIAPRSGLALNHQINVHAGVIDADFRGAMQGLF
jgi:dUTP pyrophosphatase